MSIAVNRLGPVAAIAVIAALTIAGCSTQRQGTNSTSASGSAGGCRPSAKVTDQYNATWQQAEKGLGLSGIKPTSIKLCMVDTSKYKKNRTNGQYRIALAAQGPTNSWATENEEAFRYEAKKKNVKVLYASANGDATNQVGNIQQLRAQRPDAMVVVPMGSGITGQVQAAAKQGIPVVLCSGKLGANSGAVTTVTRSYDMQGTLWADWLIKQIGDKGKIAMLSGIPGVPTAEFPKAAAEKVFAQHPNIKIVAKQYDQWSPTTSKTVASNLLAQHPDLAGIWSDSGFGDIGVAEAYKQAGKPAPPVTGDSSNAFLKAVQGTNIKFGLSPFPPGMSRQCLDTAVDILGGKSVPNFINVQAPTYTEADLQQYIRPSCSENLWVPSELPDSLLRQLKLC